MEDLRIEKAESITVSTGFKSLDALVGGGFSGGELVVLGGRPSTGKTTFAIHISLQAALKKSVSVLLFSLEMSKEMVSKRMLNVSTSIRTEDLKTGNLSSKDRSLLSSAANELSKAPIHINDSAEISISEIKGMGRTLKKQFGIGLIIVDYLQLLQFDAPVGKQNSIGEAMEELNAFAKELQVPVLVLSQISRSDNDDKRPTISRLRIGGIEAYADKILFIHKTGQHISVAGDSNREAEVAELILANNRNGPTGIIQLGFRKSCGRFEEI